MSDRYSQLVNLPVAGDLAKRIGLPTPVQLDRYTPGDPLVRGRVLLGGAGRVAGAAARVLDEADVDTATALDDPVRSVVADAGLDAAVFNPLAPADQRFKALVFDASGIVESSDLVELQRFFYPTVSRVQSSGRVIVLGGGRRALEGFTRSLAKEVGPRGIRVNAIAPGMVETDQTSGLTEEGRVRYQKLTALARLGDPDEIAGATLFFASDLSSYVSGVTINVDGGI